MEELIAEIKAVPTAHGVEQIFFPGEIEDRNTGRLRESGITLADTTWHSMEKLAQEACVSLPTTKAA
jgi:LDH2 family malate/lactate/ureidoglycolate dehydrogenase